MNLLLSFIPKVGRFSPKQSAKLGEVLGPVGYIAVGPVAVIFNLPKRLQLADREPSIFDFNEHLRTVYTSQGKPAPAWLPTPPV